MSREQINQRLARAKRLWLFLDYDGTLADFAPTPDHVICDPELVRLLAGLAKHPRLRVAVISGRRLSHIQALLPIAGVWLAGTYGIELQLASGERVERVDYQLVRPTLKALKPRWQQLIGDHQEFYLEDKGWAIAIHARFAAEDQAKELLQAAHRLADQAIKTGPFRVLGGHKFLEVGPTLAHKGQAVSYLLEHYAWPGALPVYVGDDDKDEEAFGAVKAHGGVAILVAQRPRGTLADYGLESPQAVRAWLKTLDSFGVE